MRDEMTWRKSIISNLVVFHALAVITLLSAAPRALAQWGGRDGWVEEPATKSLNVQGEPDHSYLDPASIHRGDDGLVYFSESTGVARPDEIGRTGFMKEAYDCTKNVKYMCVGIGDWRNDQKSAIDTSNDPALQVYRKYLCGDGGDGDTSIANSASSRVETSPSH